MIVGIGNDTIEIERIKKAAQNPRFIERYFTEKEISLFESRNKNIEILAGNYVVKESVSKVLGTGIKGFSLLDIEVLRNDLGAPYVNLYGGAKKLADDKEIVKIWVSITHDRDYASGIAIGEG